MYETLTKLIPGTFPKIKRQSLSTLQVNLGYLCNQSCIHCHVNAGPNRTEMMDEHNLNLIQALLLEGHVQTLDLTGGAPEMHPYFRYLVSFARQLGITVVDRCNLTILTESGYEDFGSFLAEHQVEIVASLPCYSPENVDRQRGKGVFERSITALRQLNEFGYGSADTGLVLNLVYNPQGPFLPPSQKMLELDYKHQLREHFGIEFNKLFVITNMPIQRFGSMLVSKGQFDDYLKLLRDNYDACNLHNVMCRNVISIDWQGYLYDCDFNQQLGLPLANIKKMHLRQLLTRDLDEMVINTADHCYGCTAGQGSSCGGAL